MTSIIASRKDMTQCHCGGVYKLMKPSPTEKDRRMIPATCGRCGIFRYLHPKEVK